MSCWIRKIRGNFLAIGASMAFAGAVGCASHSRSSSAGAVPPNTIAPSASSVRDFGDLTSRSISSGGASGQSAVSEQTVTSSGQSRGFDFGQTGGMGGNGGPISFDQLGQMLQGIAGQGQVNGNVYVYSIRDSQGLTYPLGVTLSQDQRAIYFLIPMVTVDPQGWANQDSLFRLLSANSSICPACFGIMGQRLFLLMGIPNANVSPDLLKEALTYVFDTVHKTQPLWGPWMQAGQQGGQQGGPGVLPGNPGGQNPGTPPPSNGGGVSNPFN